MKIALCQFDQVWEDRAANKQKITSLLAACPRISTAQWLVFPEMTLSGFSMSTRATTLAAADLAFFQTMAQAHNQWVSFGGVVDGFNKLITLNPAGAIVSAYAKIHLYSFAGENKHYTSGVTQETFLLDTLAVTPAVCFDLRFPYLFWNKAEATDVFVVIASWPARRAEHWMTLLRARAVENQCYVVGVNRTGKDPTLEYSGNSMIFDPLGKVVLDCTSAEGAFVAEIDVTKELVTTTRTRFPFFNDKKPGAQFA
ncbi:MAG: carbon-nitrogen family hydrolase [bacterium]|nr:carbon-nitrogen family hydrolase [bacterium]